MHDEQPTENPRPRVTLVGQFDDPAIPDRTESYPMNFGIDFEMQFSTR
jgi:hypothetical protein